MGSVAKSVSSAGLELGSNSGLYTLLADSAITALPASLTNAIPGSATNGMRLLIRVYGHTATGTIAIAGKAPGSVAVVTETTSTYALTETPGEYADYVTTNIFGSVDASGVTLGTGLTGGRIVIYGVQPAKASRMLAGEVKLHDKQTNVSPPIQHGLYIKDRYNLRTSQDPEWEYTGPLMSDNSLLWLQGAFSNNLTFTTIPASPTSLLTSTSVATLGTASLSAQPTAPGMILQLVLGGTAPATAASISVTGTNPSGETITEVIIPTTKAQGTYYSTNVFASVAANGVSFGAFGTGATVTVGGVFCVDATTATPGTDGLATFSIENYDSEASKIAPYCIVDETTIEAGLNKEAKVTSKGKCQAILKVGNVATETNQVTAPAQVPNEPVVGWETLVYIDNASSAFGTTQCLDCINYKVTIKPNWKTVHKSVFSPPYRVFGSAYLHYRECDAEFDFDMTKTTYTNEYQAFSQSRKRLIQIWVRGPLLGTVTGTNYYEGFQLNLIVYWIDVPEIDWSSGKESVQIKLKAKVFYDPTFGYGWNFAHWWTRLAAGW